MTNRKGNLHLKIQTFAQIIGPELEILDYITVFDMGHSF